MPERNKKRLKNSNPFFRHKSSNHKLVLKKKKQLRSKTIPKKKFLKKNFIDKDKEFRKKRYWYDETCLECCKCGFISSRIKYLLKHSTKHYEFKTPARNLQLKKSIFSCLYCHHVERNFIDLLKHVEYAHLEKKDYKKNKIDILKKRLEGIYLNIKNLNLETSSFNLCQDMNGRDNLSENGNNMYKKYESHFQMSNISEHISNISSKSVNMRPKIKTCSLKSISRISTKTYSAVCGIPSKIQVIPYKTTSDNKQIDSIRKVTLSTKPLDQQLKLEDRVGKSQECGSKIKTNTISKQEQSSSKNNHTACAICSTKFSNIEDLKRHKQSDVHDKMTFLCPTCSTVFSKIKDLKKHRKITKHSKIKLLCSVCLSFFPSKYELDIHIKTTGHKIIIKVYPKGSVLCLTCNLIFSNKNSLDLHVLNSHVGSVNFICSLCSSTFETKNALDRHKLSCKCEDNKLCTICGMRFALISDLKHHMKNGVHKTVESSVQRILANANLQQPMTHTEQKPESEFINLRQFLRTTQKQKNITCTLCQSHFATEENLKEHMEGDSHKSHSASVDDIILAGQTPTINLEQHMNNKQKHETLFPEHEVPTDKHLKQQLVTYDGEAAGNSFSISGFTNVGQNLGSTKPRKYTCTLCYKVFTAEVSLKQHMENVHKSNFASIPEVSCIGNSVHHITLNEQNPENIGTVNKSVDVTQQVVIAASRRIITCTICQKEFETDRDLEQHMDSKVHKYDTASFHIHEVASDDNLQEQLIINTGQEPRNIISVGEFTNNGQHVESNEPRKITCTLCNKKFAAEVSLKQHMEAVHKTHSASVNEVTSIENSGDHGITLNEQKPENSGYANKSFATQQLEIALPKRITCTICQKEFVAERDLEQHMNSKMHKYENASFPMHEVASDDNLQEQSITNTGQEPRNIISVGEFTNNGQHVENNMPRKIICTLCYKEFAAELSLKQHMENVHKAHSASACEVASNEDSINHNNTVNWQTPANIGSASDFKDVAQQLEKAAPKGIMCTICEREFAAEIDLAQHMHSKGHKGTQHMHSELIYNDKHVEMTKPRKITCTFCFKEFAAEVSLKQHMEHVHKTHSDSVNEITSIENSVGHDITLNEQKPEHSGSANKSTDAAQQLEIVAPKRITCTICQKEFAAERDLEQHMNSKMHKYKNASYTMHEVASDDNLQEQSNTNSGQEPRNIISVGEFTYNGQHVENNMPRKIICTLCYKEFAAELSLKQHMENVHKAHSASACEVASNKDSINHNDTLNWQTPANIRSASDFNDVAQQLKKAAPKRIMCIICEREFAAEIDLAQHMHSKGHKGTQHVHSELNYNDKHVEMTKPRKIICFCFKEFAAEVSLKQHMEHVHKTHSASVNEVTSIENLVGHDITLNEQKPEHSRSANKSTDATQQLEIVAPKRITCTICQKEFAAERDLEQHMNSKMHKYKNASYTMHEVASDDNLQEQSITNTGEKPRNIISVGEFTYNGQHVENNMPRKIICTLCYKEFAAELSLKQHMENVHKAHSASACEVASNKDSINHNNTLNWQTPANIGSASDFKDVAQQLEKAAPKGIMCTICEREFAAEIDLAQHMHSKGHKGTQHMHSELIYDDKHVEMTKPRKITCTFCFKEFAAEVSLKQHMEHVHKTHSASVNEITSIENSVGHDITLNERKPEHCGSANKSTDAAQQLEIVVPKRITCTICQKEFAAERDLEQHMNSKMHKYKNASCTMHEVASDDNLQEQSITNTGEKPRNIISVGEFTYNGQHVENNMPRKIICTLCYKEFAAELSLKQHMENVHKAHSASACEVASNKDSINHNNTLNWQTPANIGSAGDFNKVAQQMERAAPNRIMCTICEREFAAEIDLAQHMHSKRHKGTQHMHSELIYNDKHLETTKPRKIICFCFKEFAAEVSLKQHMEHVHKTNLASVNEITSIENSVGHDITLIGQKPENSGSANKSTDATQQLGKAVPKRITCTICQKEFVAERDLEQHMNSKVHKYHTASFHMHEVASDDNLQDQSITNTGQEPRNIISVGEFTNNGQHVENNMPRKIICTLCFKEFAAEVSLKQHMEHVHKTNSASVNEITSVENSVGHNITLNGQKPENSGSANKSSDATQQLGKAVLKRITCTICQKEFVAEKDLEQHKNSKVHKYDTASFHMHEVASDDNLQEQSITNTGQEPRNIISVGEFTNNGQHVENNMPRKIICTLCYKEFAAELSLKQHMENVHESLSASVRDVNQKVSDVRQKVGSSQQKKITCTLCHKQFPVEASLRQHMESNAHKTVPSSTFGFPIDKISQNQHTNYNTQKQESIASFSEAPSKSANVLGQQLCGSIKPKKNTCTICHKEFFAPEDLQQHMDSSVHDTRSICCSTCGSMFSTLKSLENHLYYTGHQSVNNECLICMRIFVSKDALDEHLKKSKIHKKAALNSVPKKNESNSKSFVSDFSCSVCGAVFSKISSLEQHMGATGHNALNYICEVCNYSFNSKSSLNQHMRDTGHYELLTCYACPRQFRAEKDVDQHIQAVHEKFNFPCQICNKIFYLKSALQNHMKSTGHSYSENLCSVCFATFSSEHALQQHINNTSHKYVYGN